MRYATTHPPMRPPFSRRLLVRSGLLARLDLFPSRRPLDAADGIIISLFQPSDGSIIIIGLLVGRGVEGWRARARARGETLA